MKKKRCLALVVSALLSFCSAETNLDVLNKIRAYLPLLRDSPIGVIDADGKYTKESGRGLNCSGFVKWIADGFYSPLTNISEPKYMSVIKLREKHISERGTPDVLQYETNRDPYFGLDWTRNIAVELGRKRGEGYSYKTYDVTDSSICKYIPNCGYPINRIEEVLNEQSILQADRIYLGSVNGMFGNNPQLWQHYHVVVFIPYYENDSLKIAVLERNKETSFAYLLKRYPNTYCHLVAIKNTGSFELMKP